MDYYTKCIGVGNKLPWYLPEDLQHFMKLTRYNTVIMGRRTFESLESQPLPYRRNVVLTAQQLYIPGVELVHNVAESIFKYPDAWVIGGSQVYQAFMPYADKLYITEVFADVNGDTYSPVITGFKYETDSPVLESITGLKYKFTTLSRGK